MYSTFTRGLELLETLDVYGPLTVGELARRTGIDKSAVSRMISACEPDGWVVRDGNRLLLGPRAALLAHLSPGAELIRAAEPLVEAVRGVTGLLVQAFALVGARAVVIASAGATNRSGQPLPAGLGTSAPLFATAASLAVAAQLGEEQLDPLLPPEPYPSPLSDLLRNPGFRAWADVTFGRRRAEAPTMRPAVRTRRELDARLAEIRASQVAYDRGEVHADLSCVAVPWSGAPVAAALACMCAPAEFGAVEHRVREVLRAAVAPGARREDILAAAAAFDASRR